MRYLIKWDRRPKVCVFTDGAIRPERGITGLAAIALDQHGTILNWWGKRIGKMTNNEAEYAAVIFALEQLRLLRPKVVSIYSDSKVVINQIRGVNTARAPALRKALAHARVLMVEFDTIDFCHIPRERNRLADALANEIADGYINPRRFSR